MVVYLASHDPEVCGCQFSLLFVKYASLHFKISARVVIQLPPPTSILKRERNINMMGGVVGIDWIAATSMATQHHLLRYFWSSKTWSKKIDKAQISYLYLYIWCLPSREVFWAVSKSKSTSRIAFNATRNFPCLKDNRTNIFKKNFKKKRPFHSIYR